MRTTLTLDDDVVDLLKRVRKARKVRHKDIVNDALRRGLTQMATRPKRRRPYRTPSTDLGPSLIGSLDNIGQVLEIAEIDPERIASRLSR
jgi:hypothetical protein